MHFTSPPSPLDFKQPLLNSAPAHCLQRRENFSVVRVTALLTLLYVFGPPIERLHAQGSLTPPGAPAPTMKSLDQVEARTAILNTSSLVKITQPRSYYLTGNLTVSSGDGIDILTNGVTLDLNGFTIRSTAASPTGTGILITSGLSEITIFNGHIRSDVTNNGSGFYGGSGFNNGIYCTGIAPMNVLVSRISVSGCLGSAIFLFNGDTTVVEACMVRAAGTYGIAASTIKSSSAIDCGNTAIAGVQITDCHGESSGGGFGVSASTAQNCFGIGQGSGFGVGATTALNCHGQSSSGIGLSIDGTASGCSGYSSSGTGLLAFMANSCRGQTSTGTALIVTHNANSF